jgi:hypothetical protein
VCLRVLVLAAACLLVVASAYEDDFGYHMSRAVPVCVEATEADGFQISAARFERAIHEHGLKVRTLQK